MKEVFIIVMIAFVLGYVAGWDGCQINLEINKRKIEKPDSWWKE